MLRILAPYTVYNGAVHKLHLFEIADDGCVSHCPVEKETADTLYVQGIAIIAGSDIDAKAIGKQIREMADNGRSLACISHAIAETIGANCGATVYTALFPFKAVQRIDSK